MGVWCEKLPLAGGVCLHVHIGECKPFVVPQTTRDFPSTAIFPELLERLHAIGNAYFIQYRPSNSGLLACHCQD